MFVRNDRRPRSGSAQVMESSLRRTEKTYSRLILALLLGLVFVVTLCWAGYQAYTRWQEHRYMHQAHAAFLAENPREIARAHVQPLGKR